MKQEQPTTGYDQFLPLPFDERIKIFNEISAENRAQLMKTHVEKWFAANHSRLTRQQIAVIEECIRFITPEAYREDRDYEKVTQEAEKLCKKAEAVFSREEALHKNSRLIA